MYKVDHYINGQTVAASGNRTAPVFNPATGEQQGEVGLASTADVDAAVDAVLSVADFAMEHWHQVTELDINPLMVRPKGQGAVAVDALVRTQQEVTD